LQSFSPYLYKYSCSFIGNGGVLNDNEQISLEYESRGYHILTQ